MKYLFGDKVIIHYKNKNYMAIYLGKHGIYTSYITMKSDNHQRGFTTIFIDDSNIFDYDKDLLEFGNDRKVKKIRKWSDL